MKRTMILCGLFLSILFLGGCGSGFVPVTGTVTLNGTPVGGAQVSFVTEDGATAYHGSTNPAGEFEITSGAHKGVPAGSYKVTVIKAPQSSAAAATMRPGDVDYMKDVAGKKEPPKGGTGAAGGAGGGKMAGGKGMMMMPGGGPNMSSGSGLKSDLPMVYALSTSTPLKATIPHDGPIKLELTEDKKGAGNKK